MCCLVRISVNNAVFRQIYSVHMYIHVNLFVVDCKMFCADVFGLVA
jgi:hypothetical protein